MGPNVDKTFLYVKKRTRNCLRVSLQSEAPSEESVTCSTVLHDSVSAGGPQQITWLFSSNISSDTCRRQNATRRQLIDSSSSVLWLSIPATWTWRHLSIKSHNVALRSDDLQFQVTIPNWSLVPMPLWLSAGRSKRCSSSVRPSVCPLYLSRPISILSCTTTRETYKLCRFKLAYHCKWPMWSFCSN